MKISLLEPPTSGLKAIIELARINPDIDILWLYGSRARGNDTPESDYDLAVAFTHYLDNPVDRRLRPELLALAWHKSLQRPLSIIDIEQVPLPLAYTVIMVKQLSHWLEWIAGSIIKKIWHPCWELDHCYVKKHYA